jgi:hypothetical protein
VAGCSGFVEAMLDHPLIARYLVRAHLKLQCLTFQKEAAVCQNILDPVETLQMQMNYFWWCKKEISFKNTKTKRLKNLNRSQDSADGIATGYGLDG